MADDAKLKKCVLENDAFFCRMVDFISPDNFGFDDDVKEELKKQKHKLVDSKLSKNEQRKLKEHGRQLLSRLDPEQNHTVTDIWSWLDEQKPFGSNIVPSLNPSEKNQQPKSKTMKTVPVKNVPVSNKAELLVKLKARLDDLRAQRKAKLSLSNGAQKIDDSSVEKKRLERKLSKLKLKGRKILSSASNIPISTNGKPEFTNVKHERSNGQTTAECDTAFSKLDFSILGMKTKDKSTKQHSKLRGKDYKKLLETVEKRDEKLKKLKEENPEKAAVVEQKQHWDAAFDRAKGEKVKDDKTLLKKNLKRKEKTKKMSEKNWKERGDHVEHKKQKRQEDRQRNLQKRKTDVKQRKLDKARKKGRLVPKKA